MKNIVILENEDLGERISKKDQNVGDIELKTGVQLRYIEQGDPNGQPIILLHGYTDSSFSYSRVLPLIDEKYHVFALDHRGHGESDQPVGGYRFSDFAADALAFMDAKNLQKAIIVGHSMGSFVAQHMAVVAAERVEKLVLIGSAPTVRNHEVLELQKTVNELTDPVPVEFAEEFQYGTTFRELPKEFMDRVVAESLKLPARLWREVMDGMMTGDVKSELSKIKAPTLIAWGDRETVFLRTEQDELKAKIPNSTLKVYEEAGHSPHWEYPEQFIEDLEEFLTQD